MVGDSVKLTITGPGEGVIDEILPRRNSFQRPAVANLDQLVIMASCAIPVTDVFLIDKMTAIAEHNKVEPIICVNKCDLAPGNELADIYRRAGYHVVMTSAATGEGVSELESLLSGKVSAFTGNSGVGKSSILNALDPDFKIDVGEVSEKLGRGRHTTRHIELFTTKSGAVIADTPGFAAFDLEQMDFTDAAELQYAFRDFAPYIENCRFTGCAHVKERGCAVREALKEGNIAKSRHQSYVRLYEQLHEIHKWEIKNNGK